VQLEPVSSLRRRLLICGGLLVFAGESAFAQGTLRGVVRDSAGKPIPNVDVGIVAHRRLVRTDEQGRFALTKLPAGATEVSFRRLGFEPRKVSVTMETADHAPFDVTLKNNAALLAAVDVSRGAIRQREMIEDYYRRVVRGVGQYITRDEIEKRWGGTPSDVLRNTAGIRFVRTTTGTKGVRFPGTHITGRDCPPMIWVDGQKAPGLEIDDITLGDIEGIELYHGPSTTPMQFSQSQNANTCGTIVIWSRPPQYQRQLQRPGSP
jgi:hypothetical protein